MGADLAPQPYEIRSFKGGLVDEVNGAQKNAYMRADNLLLAKDEQPYSRPGSVLYDAAHPQLPGGTARINRLINYAKDSNLLGIQNTRLYQYTAGNWAEIPGPSASAAFPAPVAASSRFQSAEWQKQLLIVNDAGAFPVIAYPGQGGTWIARTAGLPAIPSTPNYVVATQLAAAISLANSLRTKILAHFANPSIAGTTPHITADVTNPALIPAAATDLTSLLALTAGLLQAFRNHNFDAYTGNGTWHYYTQPINATYTYAQARLNSVTAPTDLISAATALNDLQVKFNLHDNYQSASSGFAPHAAFDNLNVIGGTMPTLTAGPSSTQNVTYLCNICTRLYTILNGHIYNYGSALPALHKNQPPGLIPNAGDGFGGAVGPSWFFGWSAPTDWPSLITAVNTLIRAYTNHEWDSEQTTPSRHWGKTTQTNALEGVFALPSAGSVYVGFQIAPDWQAIELSQYSSTQADVARVLEDLQTKYNAHDQDLTAHGTPYSSTSGGQLQGGLFIPSVDSYTYALHYDYTFQIGNTTYEVAGPVFTLELTDCPDPSVQPVTIANIPALVNATGTNYDLANVKIKIYRTLANQQVPNLIATIANGVTSYTDSAADTAIAANAVYTVGGIPNSDPPPAAKFICQIRDRVYYANYTDALGNSFPNRILQCSPAAPENCPGSFFESLPDDCQGIAPARELLIAWTKKATYRVDGTFGIDGSGSMVAIPISSTVGLAAGYSPVPFDDGVIFWGTDGIYFTDGYRVHRLNRYWETTYASLLATNSADIHGDFDPTPGGRRVYWTMQTPADDTGTPTDLNAFLVLDLNHDPTNTENAVFTTASNGAYFSPSSLAFFQGQLIRADSRGYVFKHDPAYTSDPKVNTGTTPSTWSTVPIIYDWISVAFDFDTAKNRKWVPFVTVTLKNLGTPVSCQINSNNDDGRQFEALLPIRFRQAELRGLAARTKGQATAKLSFGNYNPENTRALIKEKRRFPAGHLRCDTKQIQFTNAYCIVADSDSLGQVAVTLGGGGVPQVVLSTGSWPIDMVDQTLYFPNDGYTQGYTVLTQAADTLTLTNPGLSCPVGASLRWQALGFPKNEKFRLVNYCLHYAILGTQQTDGQEGAGANAT
jgi:hypothetical protein